MQEVFEKIIERLQSEKDRDRSKVYNTEQCDAIWYTFGAAIDAVKVTAAEYNNGWIPCSERLPEPFNNVIVCTKEGGRAIAHRCPNQALGRYYDLHGSTIDNVIAWQPLPEPYQPKGE